MLERIQDPTVTAAFVLGAYSAGAAAAFLHSRDWAARRDSLRERTWGLVALALLLLAACSQLDIIPRGIALAKALAKKQGWYSYRYYLAVAGIVLVFVAGIVLAGRHRRIFKQWSGGDWLIGAGAVFMLGYFLLRATSIHQVDPWFGIHVGCPTTNCWFEFGSASLIAVGIWRRRSAWRLPAPMTTAISSERLPGPVNSAAKQKSGRIRQGQEPAGRRKSRAGLLK